VHCSKGKQLDPELEACPREALRDEGACREETRIRLGFAGSLSFRSLFFTSGRFGQRWQGINREVSVVGMLLFEVILWFHVGIAVRKDFGQTENDLFDLGFSELGTDPNDESRDSRHRHKQVSLEVSAQCFLTPFRGGGKLFLNNLLNSKAFLLKDKEVFDST
jgi:hypothetical protein